MEKTKVIQIRMNDEDYYKVKRAFQNENMSQIIRDFLIEHANERLSNYDDMSLQEDVELQKFIDLLGHPDVQKTLFGVFKKAKEVS